MLRRWYHPSANGRNVAADGRRVALFCRIGQAIGDSEATGHCAGRTGLRLIVTTANENAGKLRRVLGTIVAMMLAGSGFGLLGALIHPEMKANPPSWKNVDRRTREIAVHRVRLNLSRPIKPDQHVRVKTGAAPAEHVRPVRPTHL
jgi:hypothetical protein